MRRCLSCLVIFFFVGFSFGSDAAPAAAVPELQVRVDPRVELICVVFRLAGNPEYNRARVAAYSQEVDQHFAPFRDHAVVKLARHLRQTQGVSYDACMSMAAHLSDGDDLQLKTPLEPWPEALDSRWTASSASNFVAQAARFAADSDFPAFFKAHEQLYATTTTRLASLMSNHMHLEWFNRFFGERPKAKFNLVPGLLNGGACYGPRASTAAGGTELFCILGVWQTDSEGLPQFSPSMLSTVVHEFSHSYANPVLEPHRQALRPAGEKMFRHLGDRMRAQAYGSSHTMFCESLVRACEVRYQSQFSGPEAARQAIMQQNARGFVCTSELANLLGQYETNRQQFPTLASYAPQLVAFFNDFAEKFEQEQVKLSTKRPKVVSMTPANGAASVSPGLDRIQVVFDRPMKDAQWSMVGSGPHFPELVGEPAYDASRTTWSVMVKLKPAWSYTFGLNSDSYAAFQSEDGTPLQPVVVKFDTSGN